MSILSRWLCRHGYHRWAPRPAHGIHGRASRPGTAMICQRCLLADWDTWVPSIAPAWDHAAGDHRCRYCGGLGTVRNV